MSAIVDDTLVTGIYRIFLEVYPLRPTIVGISYRY